MKKPFLYQIPEWLPFKEKVEVGNAKVLKSFNPNITNEEIKIWNDGFTDAFLTLYETLQLKPFIRIIKAIGNTYES